MKYKILFAVFFAILILAAGQTAFADFRDFLRDRLAVRIKYRQEKEFARSGDSERFLDSDGLRRRYVVHVPAGTPAASRLPVVLVLHGGIGTPEGTAVQTGMSDLADKFGFLAVYPQGVGRYPTWNAGACCGEALEKNVDDVAFIGRVLDDLMAHYSVDTSRVYVTGISNGGMMAYRLACEIPERIAAIAPVGATLEVKGPQPTQPVPVILIHGLKDEHAPYAGGFPTAGPNKKIHNRFSVPETIAWWVLANHCAPKPARTWRTREYEVQRYEPTAGQGGAPVVLYLLFRGGHTWPGGKDVSRVLNTGKLVYSMDASGIIWDFFTQFERNGSASRDSYGTG